MILNDEHIDDIVENIVNLRCQVCPRTSYSTTGAMASTLMVVSLQSSSVQTTKEREKKLKDKIRESKEFENFDTRKLAEVSSGARGHCILIYHLEVATNVHSQQRQAEEFAHTITTELNKVFEEKKSRLVFILLPRVFMNVLIDESEDFRDFMNNYQLVERQQDILGCDEVNSGFVLHSIFVPSNPKNVDGGMDEEDNFDYTTIFQSKINDLLGSHEQRLGNALQAASNPSRGYNNQPSVQSRCQFRYLWSMLPPKSTAAPRTKLDEALLKEARDRTLNRIANHQLADGTSKWSEKEWEEKIRRILEVGGNDYHVYDFIRRQCCGNSIKEAIFETQHKGSVNTKVNSSSGGGEEEGRNKSLAARVKKCLPLRISQQGVSSLLDYGCAEGAITSLLGEEMRVPEGKLFGADVRAIAGDGFKFIQISSENADVNESPSTGSILPGLDDDQIQVITTSMVFHHVTFIEATILELYRIIDKNDGVLILREHDCHSPPTGAFLDIVHGLYGLSWSNPVESPDFLSSYKAFYRSKEDWDTILAEYGFQPVSPRSSVQSNEYTAAERSKRKEDGTYPNVTRAYYAVYQPIKDSKRIKCLSVTGEPTSTLQTLEDLARAVEKMKDGESVVVIPNVVGGKRERENDVQVQPAIQPPRIIKPGIPLESFRGNPEDVTILESRSQPGRFFRFFRKTGNVEWIS